MAVQNLTLKVNQEGLPELVKLSEQFNKNMQEGAAALRAAQTAAPQSGTSGSRALSQSAVPRASYSNQAREENTSYNLARSVGGTGSGSSDFARQSQGLGGLVHLYATFAANIFAAEAAFRALSDAMNTAHLVQGLDQLSAASGRGLGTLAKNLNIVTDGALSLKGAMTSVAQASAAGLNNTQIMQMGEVAKKASQALGWDMANAMDRLTTGIAKNRPQLLDEIGIIVNANTIYTDYARTIGKTANSLSDFEKKQAFANAVIQQGLDKFGVIDIPTNPYTKLEASMSNLMQTGLSLINTILGPIAKLLAESPAGLATVMGTIAAVLVQKAIPALGAFRANMQAAADEATKIANIRSIAAKNAATEQVTNARIGAEAAAKVEKDILQASLANLENLRSKSSMGKSSKSYEILQRASTDIGSVTEGDLQHLDAQAERLAKTNMKAAESYAEIRDNVAIAREQHKQYNEKLAEEQAAIERTTSLRTTAGQQQALADRANRDALATRITSQAAEATQTKGFLAAVKQGWADLAKAKREGMDVQVPTGKTTVDELGKTVDVLETVKVKIGAVQTAWAGLKLAFISGAIAISTALAAIMPYLQLIGLLVAAYQLFDSVASNAAKQQEDFNKATQDSASAIKVINDSMTLYLTKKKEAFTIDSIVAMTTALGEVSKAMGQQMLAYEEFTAKANLWDKIKDGIAGAFGNSNIKILMKSTISDIQAVVKSLEFSSGQGAAMSKIADVLKIDPKSVTDSKALADAFKGMSEEAKAEKIKEVGVAIQAISDAEQKTTNSVKAFSESLGQINKEVDNIINANAFTTAEGKLGVELVNAAEKFGFALQDPLKALENIKEMGTNPKFLGMFSAAQADNIRGIGQAALSYVNQINTLETSIQKAQDQAKKAKADAEAVANSSDTGALAEMITGSAVQDAEAKVAKLQQDLASAKAESMKFVTANANLVTTLYDEGMRRAEMALGMAQQRAEMTIKHATLALATSEGVDTSKQDYQLKMQEFKIQLALVDASYAQEEATKRNTEELSKLTALQQIAVARQTLRDAKTDSSIGPTEIKGAKDTIASAQANVQRIDAIQNVRKLNAADAKEVLALLSKTDPSTLAQVMASLKQDAMDKMKRDAKSASIKAGMAVAGIDEVTQSNATQLKQEQDILANQTNYNSLLTERLNIAGQLNSYSSDSIINARQELQVESAVNDYLSKYLAIQHSIDKINRSSATQAEKDAEIEILKAKQANLDVEYDNKKLAIDYAAIKDKTAAKIAEINAEASVTLDKSRLSNSIEEARIANMDKELSLRLQMGQLDEGTYQRLKLQNDLQVQSLKFAQESARLKADKDAKDAAVTGAQGILDTAKALPEDTKGKADQVAQAEKALAAAKEQASVAGQAIATNTTLNNLAVDSLNNTAKLNAEILKQREHLADLASTGQALTTVFGDIGKAISDAANAMDAFAKSSEDRAKAIEKETDPDKKEALRKKYAKAELMDISAIAGATKKMFGEQTVANKAAQAVEKGAALERLALKAKEEVFTQENIDKAKNGITEWMQKAKDGTLIDGIAAVVKQGVGGDPWTAIPRMIAMASFISSLTGQNVSGPPPVDQGTLAGTGQQVGADGQTIGIRAGGVVGDPKATAKSLTDSIDGLSKVFFNNMGSQSSNLIKHLKGIQENTYDTAKALGAAGSVGSGNPFGAATGGSKAFTTGIGLLDNVLGGIFGGNTSKSITGTGIRGSGTASALAEDASRIQGYTNIHTETSGGWFSSGSSSDVTQMSKLDSSITKGLQGIFSNFNSVLLDTAKGLGKSRDEIQNILDTTTIDLNVSSAGLTGTEFAQKLSAEVSVQLNAIAEKAYPFISMYTKVGEESFQTATRLIKDSETVTFGLRMVGKALGDGTIEAKIATQQEIIKNFGGTADDFAAAMEAYYNGLFTDSEKLKFSFGNVQDQLKELGVSGITTNDQLKSLIASLDPSSELYASLIKLVPAFTDMTAAMQKMQDAMDNLQGQALELISTTVGTSATEAAKAAKAAQDLRRASTLRGTDPALKSMQKYVFALEDLKNAEAKLADMRKKNLSITKKAADDQINTLKSSISTMDGFIKSLDSFQNSLLTGQDSILTPGQKYQQTKQHFSDLLATATTSAITPEQQKAKDEALSQLQGASTDFLNASKLYNASGDQYALDFDLVQSAIMSTSSTLKIQKSVAQSSLDELTSQSTLMQSQLDAMDNVTNAVMDTTSAVNDVSAAQQAVSDALDAMSKDQNAYGAVVVDTFTQGTNNIVLAISELPQSIVDAQKAAEAKRIAAEKAAADKAAKQADAAKKADLAVTELIRSSGGSSRMQAQEQSAWDKMTNEEKAQYYSDNPTASSIATLVQTLFGYTTLGALVKALDPQGWNENMNINQGNLTQAQTDAALKEMSDIAIKAAEEQQAAAEAQTQAALSQMEAAGALSQAADNSDTNTSNASESSPSASSNGGEAHGGVTGRGVHLVGEYGPELVDFKTSGRIYTANDTAKLFGGQGHVHNKAIIAELRALRAELSALREQQRQETGHLITAAYDSQDQNAQTVSDAVVSTSDNQAWAAKVAASAKL